jgi:hypothetical protein
VEVEPCFRRRAEVGSMRNTPDIHGAMWGRGNGCRGDVFHWGSDVSNHSCQSQTRPLELWVQFTSTIAAWRGRHPRVARQKGNTVENKCHKNGSDCLRL